MRALLIVVISVLLSACGGGGDGGSNNAPATDPVSSTPNFPIAATFLALITGTSSYTVRSTTTSSETLTVSYSPGEITYNQYIYPSALPTFFETGIFRTNGAISNTTTAQVFFSNNPLLMWGSVNGANAGNTMQVKQQALLPVTAKVGSAGLIFSGTNYINNSSLFPDSQNQTWSLEADTAATAWLCINSTNIPSLFPELSTIWSDCFRLDQNGVVSGFKVDLTVPTSCGAYTCERKTISYR